MRRIALAALCLFAAATPARAESPDRVALAAGWYDVFDDEQAVSANVEWRPGVRYFEYVAPFLGAMATTDKALYGYFGLAGEFELGTGAYLRPNVAAGLYADGDGKDLGHAIEFRSGLETGWRADAGWGLGLGFHHISNASLSQNNQGTEILSLILTLPLGE